MFLSFVPQVILSQSQDKALRRIGELREVKLQFDTQAFCVRVRVRALYIEVTAIHIPTQQVAINTVVDYYSQSNITWCSFSKYLLQNK